MRRSYEKYPIGTKVEFAYGCTTHLGVVVDPEQGGYPCSDTSLVIKLTDGSEFDHTRFRKYGCHATSVNSVIRVINSEHFEHFDDELFEV